MRKTKNKKKTFYGQTDGQPKTTVRNLTKRKNKYKKKLFFNPYYKIVAHGRRS